jgi:hypothetical protein
MSVQVHLGFPIELDYKKTQALFEEAFPGKHVAIASYWSGGLIHIQCGCGDTHDLKLPAEREECYCGNAKDFTGHRCFGCPDK